jgi:P4 family phage/plasmid primase-like protien
MDPTIKKILKTNRVDGIFHTHVSLIQPKGKFQFNRQTLEEFWEAYCNYIEGSVQTDKGIVESDTCIIGIAEKPNQYLPVLVDVDLCVRADDFSQIEESGEMGVHLYTDEQLRFIAETYQSILRKIVDNFSEEDLTCVVLEKDIYQITRNEITYLKNGFHLHFPYIFLNKIDQETQIIPRIKQALKEANLFNNLGIEDSGNVIDSQCCKVPWLLYGSRKDGPEHKPYKVTKVFDGNLNIISLEKGFKKYQIFDQREQLIDIKGKVKYYLPRILSITTYNRAIKEIKAGTVSPLKEKLKRERKSSNTHNKLGLEDTLKIGKRLLPMVSDFRANDRNEWMNIGWILYNETEGHPDALDLWCEFSSRCEEKYDENVCIHTWERMTKGDLSMGTLRYYASVDNPAEYKKFKEEQSKKYIDLSLEGSHNDIAKALLAEYGEQFVCASYSGKTWFQFKGHIWEEIEEGIFLREKISGNFVNKYYETVKIHYTTMQENKDKSVEVMLTAKIKQTQKMIQSLKNSSFKTNVMKECAETFYNPRFKEKLDADPYLIAFKNGVYDLKLNIFRPGRPEDYLSKNMPINYINFSEDDEKVQDVHSFLEQVFPDKSLRKYFLDVSSDIFVGGNHEKIVLFWTGDGDNGKSVTQSLFEKMLGKLTIKLNTNIITGKKPSAGSTFAELARSGGGVRQAVMEEPDGDEAINVGVFKNLSGNDSFYARDLFEKGKDTREIIPLFKLIFICNKLPRIKYADKAVWNRVRVIPFESTFCRPEGSSPAPDSYEEQLRQKRFPMDKQFGKKIPSLLEPLAWVLLQHRLKITSRVEPDKVRAATEIYRKQNDIYRQFIEESITEDPIKYMSLTELYNLFKEWFKDSLPGHSLPNKNEIEEYFCKLWGTTEAGKKWKGYRQRTLQDDLADGNAVMLNEEDLVDYDAEQSNPMLVR